MNTKTMEGLVGAKTNMNLLNTPFRVFKDARRRGDLATMERAMGYVNEFHDKAEQYKEKADEGMEEDAKEAREKAESDREKAIRKRKEERRKLEERLEKSRDEHTELQEAGTVSVSEEGKVLLQENIAADGIGLDAADSVKTAVSKEAVLYTKTGEASRPEQTAGISVSV